jgi:hypothetical protein
MFRLLLAGLVVVAVAVAPVGAALAAAASAHSAVEDCHGKATDQGGSCCDADVKSKCPDACGIKCCKLMGVIATLTAEAEPSYRLPDAIDPRPPPEWRQRPTPPPPRT